MRCGATFGAGELFAYDTAKCGRDGFARDVIPECTVEERLIAPPAADLLSKPGENVVVDPNRDPGLGGLAGVHHAFNICTNVQKIKRRKDRPVRSSGDADVCPSPRPSPAGRGRRLPSPRPCPGGR